MTTVFGTPKFIYRTRYRLTANPTNSLDVYSRPLANISAIDQLYENALLSVSVSFIDFL